MAMDSVFGALPKADSPEIGRRTVVDTSEVNKKRPANPYGLGVKVVEMRRLELLTPYMRSKCSTN